MRSTASLLVLALLSASAAHGQCDPSGVFTPYGTDPYGFVEWNGDYYDAGWFHFRSRPVDGGTWSDVGGGIGGGGAYTLAAPMVDWNGMLVVGGAFTSAGGQPASNIVAWDGSQYRTLGSGLNAEVLDVIVWDGRLVAGGDFTATGDGATPLSRVAVYDEETDDWLPLGEGLGDLPSGYGTWAIGRLCVHDGELYATGRFRRSGKTVLNGIARYDELADAWRPLGSGIANMSSGNVGTALASFDGKLWLSGWFSSVGGASASFMAIWDGVSWSPAPAGPTRHTLRLLPHGDRLFGVGPFPFTIGGVEHDLAVFENGAWHGLGSSNVNWPNDVAIAADGTSLLVCGDFNSFNGAATGSLVRLDCGFAPACAADLDGDGVVTAADLSAMLSAWGSSNAAADLDADGTVGPADLSLLLSSWGMCG
ncbi:MAG: GC-type dockerin domain-anchored protein [Phycisphaerales bacterium]